MEMKQTLRNIPKYQPPEHWMVYKKKQHMPETSFVYPFRTVDHAIMKNVMYYYNQGRASDEMLFHQHHTFLSENLNSIGSLRKALGDNRSNHWA